MLQIRKTAIAVDEGEALELERIMIDRDGKDANNIVFRQLVCQ